MSHNSQPIIQMRNIHKRFHTLRGTVHALNNVTLDVMPGEVVVVVGPSGSGKSTMLRCINRLEAIDGGSIIVDGIPLTGARNINKVRAEVGMVFQSFNLFPDLTVMQNIKLAPLNVRKVSDAEATERGMALLKKVGLAHKANAMPEQLSGGQQQRVAIARALANDPPILVADEPTGNLDSKTADSVFKMFQSLVDQGKTVLMVTHDRDLAERVTRTVIISDGEIIEEYLAEAFPGLTEKQLILATRQLERQTFSPGATIIKEGAPPENFYIITDGEVEVHLRASNGETFVVARMSRGQYVGEIELLRGGNSIATVRASLTTGAEVAMLDPSEFATLMAQSRTALDAVGQIAEDRLAEHEAAISQASPKGGPQ